MRYMFANAGTTCCTARTADRKPPQSLLLTLQGALELLELVPEVPRLLFAQSALLLVVLELLLDVLNGLLDVLGIHGLVLLNVDFVARLIEHLIWALLLLNFTLEL